MHGPGNKWNWMLENQAWGDVGDVGNRVLVQSTYYDGELTLKIAKERVMKAFIWYFAMRLIRESHVPAIVLKGFEDE